MCCDELSDQKIQNSNLADVNHHLLKGKKKTTTTHQISFPDKNLIYDSKKDENNIPFIMEVRRVLPRDNKTEQQNSIEVFYDDLVNNVFDDAFTSLINRSYYLTKSDDDDDDDDDDGNYSHLRGKFSGLQYPI